MKIKLVLSLVTSLAISGSLSAAPRKHWYKDPKWWAGEAIVAAAIAADAHSTATRPPGVTESNWILGRNPSNGKVVGISLLNFSIQSTLHAAAWHVEREETNKYWNFVKYAGIPTEVAVISGHAAARNYQLK